MLLKRLFNSISIYSFSYDRTDKVDETLNILSSDISKLCTRGTRFYLISKEGSVVEVSQVTQTVNRYKRNECDCKEEIIHVYSAFDTPLLRYEGTTRQFSLYRFHSISI